jgi:hypothetical protein
MDSESDYVDSDENVPPTSQSEREQGEEGEGGDEDEIDPRELMTSPPPLSSSQHQRQDLQQYQPSSSQTITSQDPTTNHPRGSRPPNPLPSTRHSSTNSLVIPSILPTNAYTQGADATTYFTRPNRFFGAPATWNSWTQAERDLARGIDRARATDLSLHSCGAFALRRELAGDARWGRGRGRPVKGNVKGKGKAKASDVDGDRDESLDEEEDESPNDPAPVPIGSYSLPKTWTAWPMPAHQVPRDELLPRLGAEGEYRAKPDMRSSAALEECLIATATRFSRERWNRRDWQADEDKDKDEIEDDEMEGKRPLRHGDDQISEDDQQGDAVGDEGQEISDLEEDDGDNNNAEEQDVAPEDQDQDQDQEEDPDYPMFTSQPYASPSHSSFTSEAGTSSRIKNEPSSPSHSHSSLLNTLASARPVPLADDTQARELFSPSARHVLTKLDDLLLALHKARAAYAGKPTGKPRGRSVSQSLSANASASASASASVSRTREGTQTRGRGRSRGRPPSRQDASSRNNDADGEEDDDYDDGQSSPQSRSHSHHRASSANMGTSMPPTPQRMPIQHNLQKRKRPIHRTEKLHLRDWSDVVGTAALAGWDPAIIQRASERCARLFGENMLFRTFFEGNGEAEKLTGGGDSKGKEKSGKSSWYTEQLALDDESSASTTTGDEDEGAGHRVAGKIRVSAPCTDCRAAKTRCAAKGEDVGDDGDADEDEKRSGLRNGRVTCKRCAENEFECSGIAVQSRDTDEKSQWHERACPHRRCPRHEIPFRKMYHLQRHLNEVHSGSTTAVAGRSSSGKRNMRLKRPFSSASPGVGVGVGGDLDMDIDMDMDYATASEAYGLDIHVPSRDIIVCPVLDCKRHQKPFSRGTKLYEHVRRMHPDMDIDAVKKWETSRRGERRGRRKGTRSQSRNRSLSTAVNTRKNTARATTTRNTRSASGKRGRAPVSEIDIEISDDSED